jgi:hypothetical protein
VLARFNVNTYLCSIEMMWGAVVTVEFDPTRLEPQDVDLPTSYPVPDGWLRDWNTETGRITRLWPPETISGKDMERRSP